MRERLSKGILCPYCSQTNAPQASNCRWCGKALKPSFGDRPPLVGEEPLTWKCAICGRECVQCGRWKG